MKNKIIQTNILYAVIFFSFIAILGLFADYNLYRYKFYGESARNYSVGENNGTIQSEYMVNFPFKIQLIDCNGMMRNIIGQHEMNNITKLNNGYLTQVAPALSNGCIHENAEEIIKFNNYCQSHDIAFLYLNPPYKISKYDPQLPVGVTDGHNETVDKLLKELTDAGVNVMDLRQCMHEDGINQYDYFYHTDHHWTTEGAFYAYQKISRWISLKTETDLDVSLLDIDNYHVDTYKKWHLGSWGQRTGASFSGIDDFDLIYPKFDTIIFNRKTSATYSLKDALVNIEVFNNRNIYSNHVYDESYFLREINELTCLNAPSQLSVLVIGDSMTFALNPYMLATYKNYHRVQTYTTTTLKTSDIAKYHPDVVIVLRWPGYFDSDRVHFQFIDQ